MVAAVLLLAVLAVELRLFVFPAVDEPSRADAVVILGGPGDRIGRGWELAHAGVAPVVVTFVGDVRRCAPLDVDPEEICLTPDPPTTRGEARMLAELARERDWDHVVVVTAASQAVRARIRIERCFDGRLDLVTVREDGPLRQLYRVVYENGAMIKALAFQRDC